MPMRLPEAEESRCINCDAHVTRGFRRVYGDEDNRAHRCHECDSLVRLRAGSAAGREVAIPEPGEGSGRHGNTTAKEWSL
ncbi:MAG: hypothetical protein U9O06_02175 [Euryarchaeota archaeon]|nr:hypothetical protein [Euryarchaeota archaeon]